MSGPIIVVLLRFNENIYSNAKLDSSDEVILMKVTEFSPILVKDSALQS